MSEGGRFNIGNIISSMQRLGEYKPSTLMPNIPAIDKRTRSEVREDFEKKLAAIDKKALEALRDRVRDSVRADNREDLLEDFDDVDDALTKFIRYIDEFEELNSREFRAVAYKEQELKLDARHDWKAKFRLFIFRILGAVLFICTIFLIGYLDKEYEWATLPMSKYIRPVQSGITK